MWRIADEAHDAASEWLWRPGNKRWGEAVVQLLSKPPYGPPLYWHQVRAAQQLAYTAFLLHTS